MSEVYPAGEQGLHDSMNKLQDLIYFLAVIGSLEHTVKSTPLTERKLVKGRKALRIAESSVFIAYVRSTKMSSIMPIYESASLTFVMSRLETDL